MNAYFTTLAGGKRRWNSTVRQILPIPPKPLDPSTSSSGGGTSSASGSSGKVVLYTVLLDVDNPDNSLMAEMTAQVFFVAGQAQNVLTAPLAALEDDGDQADQRLVQVVDGNGKVEQRQVRTGLSDRLRVQIVDGLAEGDHLLIGAPVASGG